MNKNSNILKTEYKQRAYDNKWQLLGQVSDHDNAYHYTNNEGVKCSIIPTKWITLKVFDYEIEFV